MKILFEDIIILYINIYGIYSGGLYILIYVQDYNLKKKFKKLEKGNKVGVSYTLFDTREKELIDLDKEAYIYAENIPDVLYFIQNNMKYNSNDCLITSDLGDDAEIYGFDSYKEIQADKMEYSDFTFIKSEELGDEFEVITLVRNNKSSIYRTENWQDKVREILKENK